MATLLFDRAEADAAVAKALGSAPAAEFANASKWYADVNK